MHWNVHPPYHITLQKDSFPLPRREFRVLGLGKKVISPILSLCSTWTRKGWSWLRTGQWLAAEGEQSLPPQIGPFDIRIALG